MEAIDKKRASGSGHAEESGSHYTKAQQLVKQSEEELEAIQANITKAQAAKKALHSQETPLLKRRTELELILKDLKDKLSGSKGSKAEAEKELQSLKKKLKETNAKLDELTKEYQTISASEEEHSLVYQRLDQRLADLASKRDRSAKFTSRKDRDADIKKQITRVTKQRNETQKQIDSLQAEMNDSQAALTRILADIEKKEKQIADNRTQATAINEAMDKLSKRRFASVDTRKAAWKEESTLNGEFTELSSKMEKAQRNLQSTMDKDLYRGLEGVKTIVAELGLTGVYGPLIELFECGPEFHTCVEVTAGNSLFHVVVDSEATATRVVKELFSRKLGRVTFIPLSRINPQRPDYPASTDAVPMISNLRYDPKYEKAMVQVFGKTLIARDIHVAAHMAHVHNLNTITLSGDRVDKKGALTGGHSEHNDRSRLGAQADIRANQQRYEEVKEELRKVRSDIDKLSTEVEKASIEQTKQQELKSSIRSQTEQLTHDVTQLKKEHKTSMDNIARHEKLLPPLRASLASLETNLESLDSEAKSEFRSGLTDDEEDELKRITSELDQAKRDLLKVRAQKSEVESSKVQLESLLTINLNRREDELNARLNTATQEDDADSIHRDETELEQVLTQLKDIAAELKTTEKEIEDGTNAVRTLQDQLEKHKVTLA